MQYMVPWAYPRPQPKRRFDRFSRFGVTVCKTVRPMLSVSCNVGLLSQTLGWIKVPLSTEVGLDPGHVVSGGNPAPLNFRPISIEAKRLDG